MKEKWVRINTIEGYEDIKDCYWISNNDEDKIINRNTGKQLKSSLNSHGYKRVRLMTVDGKVKNCKVHILKAKAFIYGPNLLSVTLIRHLDDCKTNNVLTNLAWGSYSNNIQDSMRNGRYNYEAAAKGRTRGYIKGAVMGAKKVSKPIRCLETKIIYSNAYEASRQLGIDRANINRCCRGKQHTAKGFHFEFVNKEEVNNDDMEREQIR